MNKQLLTGEDILLSKNASAIIHIHEYGLKPSRYSLGLSLVGMQGKEAIGGRLHLTNYRLLFKSHFLNRVTGTLSIFLPTIHSVRDVSKGIGKKVEITTQTQTFAFVVWGIPELIQAIHHAKNNLSPLQQQHLAAAAGTEYQKIK